jgi:hypothetical protein
MPALHQRTVIRRTIKTLLTNTTAAEGRVFTMRMEPLRKVDLPAICIYPGTETVDDDSVDTSPRVLTRQLPIAIQGWVTQTDDVDDLMDALALEIETAMHADPYLGEDVASESILESTDPDIGRMGDRNVGMIELVYRVTYMTYAPEAPADLNDFNTVGATHDINGAVHEDEQSEDVFTVQESA